MTLPSAGQDHRTASTGGADAPAAPPCYNPAQATRLLARTPPSWPTGSATHRGPEPRHGHRRPRLALLPAGPAERADRPGPARRRLPGLDPRPRQADHRGEQPDRLPSGLRLSLD